MLLGNHRNLSELGMLTRYGGSKKWNRKPNRNRPFEIETGQKTRFRLRFRVIFGTAALYCSPAKTQTITYSSENKSQINRVQRGYFKVCYIKYLFQLKNAYTEGDT
jgi:hypothetical protein